MAGDGFPFAMLVTTLEADPYLGRILTGRIESRRHHDQSPASRR